MMEGISGEAASLAGHLKLSNLCWIYDNNKITIEGHTEWAFSEDVATRFIAYGWNVTARGRRQRPRDARARLQHLQEGEGAPDADHRRQPHRVGLAQQAGHARRPRRAARRGRDQAHQAQLRLAGGRQVPGARRRARALRRRHGRARPGAAHQVDGAVRAVPRQVSRSRRPGVPDAAPRAPGRLGQEPDAVSARSQGGGGPRRLRQGAQHAGAERAVPARRLGRPRAVDEDTAHVRGRRRLHARTTTAGGTSTSASASTPWAPS